MFLKMGYCYVCMYNISMVLACIVLSCYVFVYFGLLVASI